jgi:hypothetical protein
MGMRSVFTPGQRTAMRRATEKVSDRPTHERRSVLEGLAARYGVQPGDILAAVAPEYGPYAKRYATVQGARANGGRAFWCEPCGAYHAVNRAVSVSVAYRQHRDWLKMAGKAYRSCTRWARHAGLADSGTGPRDHPKSWKKDL